MKIAFIVSQYPSVSETFIHNQIVGMLEMGHNVDVYAKSACDKRNKRILNKGSEQVYYCGKLQHRTAQYMEIFRNLLRHFLHYPVKTVKLALLIIKLKARKELEYVHYLMNMYFMKYDIVICHFGYNGLIGAYLKKNSIIQSRIAVSFHGYDMSGYLNRHGDSIYDEVFKYADIIMPISLFWKKKLISIGCPEDKIIVHHMGVDTQKFIRDTPDNNENILRILSIGRLVPKKGFEYSIRAVCELAKKHELQYIIAGTGPEKEQLYKLIKERNADEYIKLAGSKTPDGILELLKWADVLLTPSITASDGDMEGIPVVIMEAMAMEIPVIASMHSGIPEIISDNVSGYIVVERDEKEILEKLLFIIENPDRARLIGKNGRQTILKGFDSKKLNEKLIRLLTEK